MFLRTLFSPIHGVFFTITKVSKEVLKRMHFTNGKKVGKLREYTYVAPGLINKVSRGRKINSSLAWAKVKRIIIVQDENFPDFSDKFSS